MKRKKKPFLLIEVLLSVTLISLCLYPLLGMQYRLTQAETRSLEKQQLTRWANDVYVEILQGIYDGRVLGAPGLATFEKFQEKQVTAFPRRIFLQFAENRLIPYECSIEWIPIFEASEENTQKDSFRLIEIHLSFRREGEIEFTHLFKYRCVLQKAGNPSESLL